MFLSGGSVHARFGIDFSRNLISNLEIHGELAYIPEYSKKDSTSFLLGTLFLTAANTTFFLGYYKNEKGFSSGEMPE